MYKNINISNFRGIDNLEIEDLKTINLLLGNNNCGKTSIIEAIFLITGISNPLLNININSFRRLTHTEIDDFRFIYKDLDYNNLLKISSIDKDNNKRKLIIKPKYSDEKNENNSININSNSTTNNIKGLSLDFEINSIKYKAENIITKDSSIGNQILFSQFLSSKYKENLTGTFITHDLNYLNLTERLENIIQDKKEKEIVEILKIMDNKITDIQLGTKGMIYFDIGIKRRIPLNIMGDGFIKLFNILVVLIESRSNIVLIDEIENGLHFSALNNLLESILKVAFEKNIQIFITSHNFEVLKYLNEVLEKKSDSIKNEIRSYTIIKNKDSIKSYKYDYESFNHAIAYETEIR